MSQVQAYFDRNNLLSDCQTGFRRGFSTEIALNNILEDWYISLNDKNNNIVIACFLDFKRAFETIDRLKLIAKLEKYGVKGKAIDFFKHYLKNRKQYTIYQDERSNLIDNNIGLPQGSQLAPLLFIIYINDMINVLKYCKIQMYADDTLIYISGNNLDDLVRKLNADLENISKWLKFNKVKNNVVKTKYMILKNKFKKYNVDNITIVMDDIEVEYVESMKYLGVIIDTNLSFKEHYESVIAKITQKTNFLNRNSKCLSIWTKKLVYNSIILPHLTYCPTILYVAPKCIIQTLQIIQNRCMKIILEENYYAHSLDLLKRLEWFDVKNMIMYFTILFINNARYNILNKYLVLNEDIHSYNTRNSARFCIRNIRIKSIFDRSIMDYNNIVTNDMKDMNKKIFKLKLKEDMLNKQNSQ